MLPAGGDAAVLMAPSCAASGASRSAGAVALRCLHATAPQRTLRGKQDWMQLFASLSICRCGRAATTTSATSGWTGCTPTAGSAGLVTQLHHASLLARCNVACGAGQPKSRVCQHMFQVHQAAAAATAPATCRCLRVERAPLHVLLPLVAVGLASDVTLYLSTLLSNSATTRWPVTMQESNTAHPAAVSR